MKNLTTILIFTIFLSACAYNMSAKGLKRIPEAVSELQAEYCNLLLEDRMVVRIEMMGKDVEIPVSCD